MELLGSFCKSCEAGAGFLLWRNPNGKRLRGVEQVQDVRCQLTDCGVFKHYCEGHSQSQMLLNLQPSTQLLST